MDIFKVKLEYSLLEFRMLFNTLNFRKAYGQSDIHVHIRIFPVALDVKHNLVLYNGRSLVLST
jgi:hypothetical protein